MTMRRRLAPGLLLILGAALGGVACDAELDESLFQRRVEKTFSEVNAGFGIARRRGPISDMVRGDQIYSIDTERLYAEYEAGGKKTSSFFDALEARLSAEAKARRQTLAQAESTLIPIVKSGTWLKVQDLGAIGPKRIQDQIRPWRKEIATDVYVLLGVPEDLLGFRYASLADMETASEKTPDAWLETAISNLARAVGTSTGSELRGRDGRLLVYSLLEIDGISAALLDAGFRRRMLALFSAEELGAAIPNRDVLIVFDAVDVAARKPIRARTHELYEARNHPGFRGLLRFDASSISILESANPEADAKKAAAQP